MSELKRRLKITRSGLLKTNLGVDYEWGIIDDGKAFWKATVAKKAKVASEQYKECLDREAKIYDSPGKPLECLEKNEDNPIDVEIHESLVGQKMLFLLSLDRS